MDIFNYDNRNLRILNILEENFFVQEKYLTDVLKVSSKTVQNEIKELNKMFKGVAYIKNANFKYALYIIKLEDYLKVKSQIYDIYKNFDSSKVRLVYIFKKLIEAKEAYLIDELAYEMVVSRGTLNSDIKKLKNILADYNISIEGKTNKGIEIVADEKDIRFYVLENIYNYKYKEDIFDRDDYEKIDYLFETNNIDKHGRNEFIKYLTISIDRYANNFKINLKSPRYDDLVNEYTKDFVDQVCRYINSRYMIDLPEDEKKFLIICFATMRLPSNISNLVDHIKYSNEYSELVMKIMDKISYEFGLDIEFSNIREEFIYHIYFLMKRIRYGVRYKNNMKEIIKERYPISYKMAKSASSLIKETYGFDISDDEICYLAIYFETFISNIDSGKMINILLVSNSGPAYKRLMLQELNKTLSGNAIVTSVTEFETDINLDYFDLIISTVKKTFDTNTMVIHQNEILDMEYIKKEISFVKYMGKMNIPLIRGMESLIISSISENTFFICDSDKSYRENLGHMIENLADKKLIDSGFYERIKEREKKSSMLFTSQIAFPHTVNENSNKILISLGVAEDGFSDNKDLKLVFLVALPLNIENSTMLVRTYDELISIIREKNVVCDISKIKTYDELVDYFIKNTNLYR